MASEGAEHGSSFMETVSENIHEYKESSSSDSDGDGPLLRFKKKKFLGRTETVHAVLGGGKSADIILWRNKQLSGSVFAGVTIVWLLFELLGYHLVTFLCHSLILFLTVVFLWSNIAKFLNRSPPKFPEVALPEELVISAASRLRYEINEVSITFQYISSGKDLKTFLMVISGLWVASVVGNWFSFLTLSYIVFVVLHTLPALYEKYEDRVDSVAEKALVQAKKHYATIDNKVLRKLPSFSFAGKKQH